MAIETQYFERKLGDLAMWTAISKACIVLATLLLLTTDQSTAQAVGSETVSIANKSRPLAEIVKTIEERHGIVITYEDPPYVHASQLVDVSDSVRKQKVPSSLPVLVPRGGSMAFRYDRIARPIDDLPRVLNSLTAQYHSTGLAGAFRLDRSSNSFHIIPRTMRNAGGMEEPYRAILDSVVQVRAGERSVYEVVAEVLTELTQATGVKVSKGTMPLNLLAKTNVSTIVATQQARSLLVSILASTARRLSWQLLYDPTVTKGFVLNIHEVRAQALKSQ